MTLSKRLCAAGYHTLSALLFLAVYLGSATASAQIAVVIDGPSEQNSHRYARLISELEELTRDSPSSLKLAPKPTHVGQHSLKSARAQLKAALADKRVKAIVGFGYFVGVAAGELRPAPPKPILLPYGAPQYQDLPLKRGASGRKNLTYLTGFLDFERDLRVFREVIHDRNVAFLVQKDVLAVARKISPPEELVFEDPKVHLVPYAATAASALEALPKNAEAVYLPLSFRMSFSEMQGLIEELNQRKIPTYAGMGPEWVQKGAFVTLMPPDLETERFRRIALRLRDALSGEPLQDMITSFPPHTELFINMDTARKIGVFPRFELMTEARLTRSTTRDSGQKLTLIQAVDLALKNNPSYEATLSALRAAKSELRESRGALLPSVNASGEFFWLDPDAANTLANAERTLSWSVSGQQLLFSPLAIQAYRAQEKGVDAVAESRRTAGLDLSLEVIQSFLRVLQARAVEELNRDNLKRVRTNRSLAELRVEIGTSGPQDVARWNIALAGGRAETIAASARRNQAEIDLNRILNVDLEKSFTPQLPERPEVLLIEPRVESFIHDIYSFKIFRAFMANEALRNSPEIAQLDAQIMAQDRLIHGYMQQLYIPTVGVFGGFTNVLSRSGAGSGPITIPGVPQRDDFTWQLGVNLNFTLFDDTRYGTLQRLRQIRSQLSLQKANLANLIEQRVRSALHQAGASRAAVGLRKDAVEAARTNLSAVTSAYREGTATIITLVDAQSQALEAEINAANAQYTFLSDYAEAERASGCLIRFRPADERQSYLERLEAFAEEMRIKDGHSK